MMLNREGCLVALMACAGVPRSLGKGLRAVRRGTRWIVVTPGGPSQRGCDGPRRHSRLCRLSLRPTARAVARNHARFSLALPRCRRPVRGLAGAM